MARPYTREVAVDVAEVEKVVAVLVAVEVTVVVADEVMVDETVLVGVEVCVVTRHP
jgi:uncharacterized membrane protein